MASKDAKPPVSAAAGAADTPLQEPGWANGLRSMYQSVVDEPLPDSFEALLKKLDETE